MFADPKHGDGSFVITRSPTRLGTSAFDQSLPSVSPLSMPIKRTHLMAAVDGDARADLAFAYLGKSRCGGTRQQKSQCFPTRNCLPSDLNGGGNRAESRPVKDFRLATTDNHSL